ncbi:hypothetical protein WMY93_028375 [Mugilogobius chulae]|uniref:G-protein coupled receptors family 1 profile domain-containing protein n=1 Tax=Mugilogobius chulae TaxID=88201 RepID=A0AAW0MSM9_9GOBI
MEYYQPSPSAMPNSSDNVLLLLEGLTVGSSDSSGPSLLVFLFLLLVYLFVVISNLSITVLILLKRSLHQPVYLLYLNLSINDLLGNTTVIPRLLVDLLRPASLRHIHLYSCIVQAFLSHLFNTTAHTILMIMAFDRYMAICSPLRYSAIISIGSIVVTYTKITVVCWTSKNASLNRKALQTCSTHLFSYLLFLCSGFLIIIFHRFPHLVQERMFITVMYHLLPSGLNPLIYGMQSKEIRRSFSELVGKVSSFP